MPRVGPEPLNELQRDILRRLVARGDAGVTISRTKKGGDWCGGTLRALNRRGLAMRTCDRDADDRPIHGTWRYVATSIGHYEIRRLDGAPAVEAVR